MTTSNPWKMTVIALAIALPCLALGAGAMAVRSANNGKSLALSRPAPAVVEDCNRYAAASERDVGRIVRDGAIGGAVGAGVGAAGGAIADGGSGAGKGAGIGALLGITIGALRGLNEENQKSEPARMAYADCLARRGF
jgi:hypothetical protein